jgi:hypothetical protein
MTRVERLATAVAVVTRVVVTTSTKQDRLESGWEMSALACYVNVGKMSCSVGGLHDDENALQLSSTNEGRHDESMTRESRNTAAQQRRLAQESPR